MLVEINMIQNHAPSNLNRDDTGSPKEALFGGVPRARISSQCLKRSIRTSPIFRASLGGLLGERTRRFPGKLRTELLALGASESEADGIAAKATGFGSDKESEDGETRQLIFLGHDEVRPLAEALLAIFREVGAKRFEGLKPEELAKRVGGKLPRSVDVALFGRMTTSAAFEDVQAAAQVAHAIGTTRLEHEFDYYTAVDDLVQASDETGAGMIGDVEFNSATYYKYFSIDWDAFVERLGDDAETAGKALGAFITAAALTTPSGKQNTFAAHNPPDAVLVQVKDAKMPVSYANAFVRPANPRRDSDVVDESVQKLVDYAGKLNSAYGIKPTASFWLTTRGWDMPGVETVDSLPTLIESLSACVRNGASK